MFDSPVSEGSIFIVGLLEVEQSQSEVYHGLKGLHMSIKTRNSLTGNGIHVTPLFAEVGLIVLRSTETILSRDVM